MPEHEGHEARAVYDIEVEDPRLTGRRRAVADWGVGEELFDRMPARRRFRSGDSHRRDVHRTGRFEPAERDEPRGARAITDEPRGARTITDEPRGARTITDEPRGARTITEEPRGVRVRARVAEPPLVDETSRRERLEDALERFDPRGEEVAAPAPEPPAPIEPIDPVAPPAPLPVPDAVARPPEGRRTVVIRGRGAEPAWTPRRRPPRTVGERVGPRPDRLMAWAVALGMLLILIAILTAHG